MICVRFKRLHPDARQPVRASAAAACFDLHALHGADTRSGSLHRVGTGLAVELPPGFVMLLFPRSGLAVNHGLRLANCVGVVDSDYRGEVVVAIRSEARGDQPSTSYRINAGDRIAQAMVVRLPDVLLEEVEELSETERGAGGFGHTGA